eukprot:gene44259-54123_t
MSTIFSIIEHLPFTSPRSRRATKLKQLREMYLNRKIHALNKDRVRSMLTRKLTRGVQYDQHTIPKELQALLPNNTDFLKALDEAQQRFYPRYVELRNARLQNQAKLRSQVEAGKLDYREDTAWIRERRWKVAQIPAILQKRP